MISLSGIIEDTLDATNAVENIGTFFISKPKHKKITKKKPRLHREIDNFRIFSVLGPIDDVDAHDDNTEIKESIGKAKNRSKLDFLNVLVTGFNLFGLMMVQIHSIKINVMH